jgi:hypothetical protein
VLTGRQPTSGGGGHTNIDPVEADDRARHIRDDAKAAEIGSDADRGLDRRSLVCVDRDELRKGLITLSGASDLDHVLALGQAVDDQRGSAASLSVDEHGEAGYVCGDQQ